MKIRRPLAFLGIGLVSTTAAFADGPPPKAPPAAPTTPPVMTVAPPAGTAPVLKAPTDLGSKRQTTFNAALSRAGLGALGITPPPAHAKVTPLAPVTNGMRILRVGAAAYASSTPEYPEGVFLLDGIPPPVPGFATLGVQGLPDFQGLIAPKGKITIEASVESDKFYFLDCRAHGVFPPNAPVKIVFSRDGSTTPQEISPEDGHYVYAFRSPTGTFLRINITLGFKGQSAFFGCEITKAS